MKISLFPNREKDPGLALTRRLCRELRKYPCSVFMDGSFREEFAGEGVAFEEEAGLYRDKNFLIVLGGDGTIMRVARHAALTSAPILGVNLGRLGYLAEIEPDEIGLVGGLFTGRYVVEDRMTLSVTIANPGKKAEVMPPAINDAVISTGFLPRIVDIVLTCESEEMKHYRADGIVVSTPTGSSAYSLAAGGPLIDPRMSCICVTPVAPQSLFDKPIVFPDHLSLDFRVGKGRYKDEQVWLTIDGTENVELFDGASVRIARSPHVARMVKIKNNNFFRILHNKMSEL